jgi:hypothetical protein
MELGIKQIVPDQHAIDNEVDGTDLKDNSLRRDWSEDEERRAKRKFVLPTQLTCPNCVESQHSNWSMGLQGS